MADYGEGYKYQRSVTAHLASLLSKDRTVKDYQIFYEVQEFHPFDDIVLAVNYDDSEECSLYFIQAKSGKIKLEINKYMKGYDEITKKRNWNCLQNIGKINSNNIQFWYFACQKYSTQTTSFLKGTEKHELQIKQHIPGNKSIITNKIYKLYSLDEDVAMEYQKFFNDFYIFLAQPNTHIIVNRLKDMWKSNDAAQIIEYLDKYFTKNKKGSLNKVDFEHQLLKNYFSDSIVTPTKILPFKKQPALAWNELTLAYHVTVIKNEIDIEACLFGAVFQSITEEISIEQWNSFVDNGGRLPKEYKEQVITNSMKPETLKDLLIHLWIHRSIPLILRTNTALQLLKDFSHLDQHYVIIDSDPGRRFDEIMSYNVTAIKNLGKATDKLLQSISVSMQGREPASLYSVINGDRRLVQALSCSEILKLIQPRKNYLSKDCLEGDNYMLFIIEVVNPQNENYENYKPNGDNISIYCEFDQSNKIYDKIKGDPKFRNYKIYCLRSEGDKLIFVSECRDSLSELHNFLIDQYGNHVYSTTEASVVPVIGKVTRKTCLKYLQRYMRKATIDKKVYQSSSIKETADSTITFSETVFPEQNFFKEVNDKICVVVGKAGIGKTTLLLSLLQKCDSQYYVLFCNLAQFQEDLLRHTRKLFEDPLNFLWNKQKSLTYKHFLDTFLNCRKRLILILDSFDEVAPTCEDQVVKLMRKLNEETCLEKIVIGSRLLTVKLLSNQFPHIGIVKIDPFSSEHNGNKYIENWGFNEETLQDMPSEFAANPLYLDMLKTISRNSNIDLHKLSSWTLYECIVDLEITRYCQRIRHVFDDYEKENFLKFYWELAVKSIFGSNQVTEKFAVNKQIKFCNYAKLGFVKYFNENEEPMFVHSTFAEFFAANWLIKTTDEQDAKYIYQKMLNSAQLDVLRIHSEQFPLHKIVYDNETVSSDTICEKISKLCREDEEMLVQTDGVGRTGLHLAAIRCRNDKGRCLETIIQSMRERGYDLYSRDKLLNWTWIDICENNFCFNITDIPPAYVRIQEAYWSYRAYHAMTNPNSVDYVRNNVDFSRMYKMIIRYPSLFNIISDVLFVRYFENKNFIRFRNFCLNMGVTTAKLPKYFKLGDLQLTPLHMAVIFSNINVITACLDRGDAINAKDVFGCTPLYYSIGKDDSETVKLLLKRGANVALHPNLHWGFNIFQLSLQKRTKAIIEMLIERVNIKKVGSNWLCDGIKFGDLEVTAMLLNANADPNAEVRVFQNTHFEIEVLTRDVLGVVRQLGSHGNDVNAITIEELILLDDSFKKFIPYRNCWLNNLNYLTRPLHAAVHAGRKDIVEVLLKNGADVNLEIRCDNSDDESYITILDHCYDCTPLYCAIKSRAIDMMELLLNYRANVNYINKQSLTPLAAAINDKPINFFNDRVRFVLTGTVLVTYENTWYYSVLHKLKDLVEHMHNLDWPSVQAGLLRRNLQLVEILLKHGADVNFKNKHKSTALDDALEKRNWTMIKFLLEKENNAHFSEKIVFTNLLDLVPREHIKIIELLLKGGVDPNLKSACGVTPLYVAARKRNPDLVRLLLENGATPNIVTCTGALVDKAKERGEIDVVTWLWDLQERCCPSLSDDSGYPDEVLHLIRTIESQINVNLVEEIDISRDLTNKKLKLIKRLLEYTADLTNPRGIKYINAVRELGNKEVDQILIRNFIRVHKTEIEGYTAVGYAATQRNQAMIDILARNGEDVNSTNKMGYTPLVCIIRKEVDEFVVELLLKNGADVNLADDHGSSPLIVAVEMRNIRITKVLVENKVIVDYVSKCGRTPLIAAIIEKDPVIVDILLNKGADVNFASESGLTPLYAALLTGNTEIIKMLFSYGAISDIETCGNKLLFHAATSDHYRLVSLLLCKIVLPKQFNIPIHDGFIRKVLHNQANVNAVNDLGSTPLHLATQAGHATVVYSLLYCDADPNLVDLQGRTALHYAVLINRKDIVEDLLEKKAAAPIADNDGLTSLDYAMRSGNRGIVNILMRKSRKKSFLLRSVIRRLYSDCIK